MKRTPLFESHQRLGGKLIEFGGWEMPVQYTGITDEHLAVRKAAGIFDISHMGEVLVSGPAAEDFLNDALTNDVRKLAVGAGQYTLMCNEQGGAIDDLYCYRLADQEYLLIVNASRVDADFGWLEGRAKAFPWNADLTLKDISDVTGAVAVQGPRVVEFIDQSFSGPPLGGTQVAAPTGLKKNHIARFKCATGEAWVSRTGYTGEDGFEIVAPAADIVGIWSQLLATGAPHGLKAAGLGARDTLRTEMCYPLYGHELSLDISPIQAGLGFFVSFEKGEFVGRSPLIEEKGRGPARKLVAFKLTERGAPPRPQYSIFSSGNQPIGYVASGTQSPSLNIGIGLGYVLPEFARPETPLQIEVRGRRFSAVVVPKPIYRKP